MEEDPETEKDVSKMGSQNGFTRFVMTFSLFLEFRIKRLISANASKCETGDALPFFRLPCCELLSTFPQDAQQISASLRCYRRLFQRKAN